MIEVTHLTKVYPGRVALDDVSFSVEKGEIVGLLGVNGAGKTTTLRILSSFLSPTRGTVRVAGFDALRQSMELRRRIGYLPETNPLYPEMRVEEYLGFRGRIKGIDSSKLASRVGAAVERCGLRERRRSIIGTLSRGLKQRVGLADAILHEPELVILDEPTVGLDPNQIREVRELIRELGKERTVLLSTHILSEAERICGRVIILHQGRVVASGPPAEVSAKLTHRGRVRVEARGDATVIRAALGSIPGVTRVTSLRQEAAPAFLLESEEGRDVRADVFRSASSGGWELQELAFERMSLEDAFVEVTAEPKSTAVPEAADDAPKGSAVVSFLKELFRG